MCLVFGTTTSFAAAKTKTAKMPRKMPSKKNVNKVVKKAKSRLGCRYVWAAEGPRSFDCSGFVYWTYKNSKAKVKKKVIRSSCQGLYHSLGKYKVSNKLSKARKGDIILYKNGGRYTHTAIALSKTKMIHASSSKRKICIAKKRDVRHSGVAIIRVLK